MRPLFDSGQGATAFRDRIFAQGDLHAAGSVISRLQSEFQGPSEGQSVAIGPRPLHVAKKHAQAAAFAKAVSAVIANAREAAR